LQLQSAFHFDRNRHEARLSMARIACDSASVEIIGEEVPETVTRLGTIAIAYFDIPAAVEAGRQYWMPIRNAPADYCRSGAHNL
jgi:hypothetical protein